MSVRVRFAPSPTGQLHIGNVRTALYSWLWARQTGGAFVLRIEDTDEKRSTPEAVATVYESLRWLGLDWDEGPVFQSAPERQAAYAEALVALEAAGHLYPCTCSRREWMEIASAPHGEGPPRYPGTCRAGPSHPERPAALRFRLHGPTPRFDDLVFGPSGGTDEGDFVVRRADGLVAYQLAVVVDDRDQRITEVVRGADLLAATGLQRALFAALGAPAPAALHVPLVLGKDGERLAKRNGARGVRRYREEGLEAEELLGLLGASLVLVPPGSRATRAELLERSETLVEGLPRKPLTLTPERGDA